MKRRALVSVILPLMLFAATSARADWSPEALAADETLEFLTVGAEEGEHWSTVWLAVVDGQVFVRLGERAANRMRNSTRWPYVDVRVGNVTYPNVRVEPTPQMAERVAEAMAEKYWFDIFVRYLPHPLTARLVPGDRGPL